MEHYVVKILTGCKHAILINKVKKKFKNNKLLQILSLYLI